MVEKDASFGETTQNIRIFSVNTLFSREKKNPNNNYNKKQTENTVMDRRKNIYLSFS